MPGLSPPSARATSTGLVPAPIECEELTTPRSGVGPYWNTYPVATPLGFTLPCRTTPVGLTLVAAPVVAVGDAARAAAGRHPAITNATARTFEMRLTATSSARIYIVHIPAGGL